jgi:hypothetical protein
MTGRFAFAPLRGVGSRGILDFLSPDTSAPHPMNSRREWEVEPFEPFSPPDIFTSPREAEGDLVFPQARRVRAFLPPDTFAFPRERLSMDSMGAGSRGGEIFSTRTPSPPRSKDFR